MFPAQWYEAMSNHIAETVNSEEPPYHEVSNFMIANSIQFDVVDYCEIGEMVQKALLEANNFFEQMSMPQRFLNEKIDLYEIYMSKKTGKPKTDYPGMLIDQ